MVPALKESSSKDVNNHRVDNHSHDTQSYEGNREISDQRSEYAESWKSRKKGDLQYAMTTNEDGRLVPMTDFNGQPVRFPTDEEMKKKLKECAQLHRFESVTAFCFSA